MTLVVRIVFHCLSLGSALHASAGLLPAGELCPAHSASSP
jgi:hypothetical protein